MRSLLGAVVVLGACGDNISPPAPVYGVQAGARLEPRFWDAGDGARLLRAWYDRELDVECRFDLAADGRFRCLPTELPSRTLYADAACTTALVAWPACKPQPRFAGGDARATAECPRPAARPMFEIGAEHAATRVFEMAGDTCRPVDVPKGHRVYLRGNERPPTQFVAAALDASPATSRLVPYVYRGEDGSFEATGIWDSERDAECNGSNLAPPAEEQACYPTEIALHYDFLFSDASCTEFAAVDLADARPCHPPTAVNTSAQPYGRYFREIGAQIPPEAVHRSESPGTCSPEPLWTFDETFWREGSAIPQDAYASLITVFDGRSRILAARYVAETGEPLSTSQRFFDTTIDLPCDPVRVAHGTRCLGAFSTNVGMLEGLHADPACTTPVVYYGETPPPLVLAPHVARDACDDIQYDAAYAVGAKLETDMIYRRDGTACVERPLGSGEHVYRVGARVELPVLVPD